MKQRIVQVILLAACITGGCAQLLPVNQEDPGGSNGGAPDTRTSNTETPDPLPRKTVIETVETDADRLLDYYGYLTDLKGDKLLQEYERVKGLFAEKPNDVNRMQMVMLMSSQSAPFRDINAARVLLQAWLGYEYNTYSKLWPLALLLDNYLSEIRRLEEAGMHLEVEFNANADLITRQAQDLERQTQALKSERKKTKALQKKLDALLEIEMNLINREKDTAPDTR